MMIKIDDLYVHPVPSDVGDFFISGTGYLCARAPIRACLSETPLIDYGIRTNNQILGMATREQCVRAGIAPGEGWSGVILRPDATTCS